MSHGEENMAEPRAQILADFAGLAERLRRSTVQVRGRAHGGGSGVIWRGDGLIVTSGKDPELYQFLKSMETLKEGLDPETWLILSTDTELLKYLKSPGP